MTKEQMIEKIQETESFLYSLCESDWRQQFVGDSVSVACDKKTYA